MNCAAQPYLWGYPLKVKSTGGNFHFYVHAPHAFITNCAASLGSLYHVLGCVAFSILWTESQLVKSSVNFGLRGNIVMVAHFPSNLG